jgi:multidrug efflux pump subunit AcrB
LAGIPYDYWSQYEDIDMILLEIGGISIAVGFGIALIFLFFKINSERNHSTSNVFIGSLIGALLIAVTMILSIVAVVGLSVLADVTLTGFSVMSFVLSVGFVVEYTVHIIARWLRCDMSYDTSEKRVETTMSFLMIPT